MSRARQIAIRGLLLATAPLFMCSSLYAEPPTPIHPAEAVAETEVITFHPANPGGDARKGDCWSESDAIDRPGAWRCAVDNMIYDPCFSDPAPGGNLICGADPARGQKGFVLQPIKPLPKPRSDYSSDPIPWMVKLADGSVCALTTGASSQVDGKDLPYECSDSRECSDDGKCPYLTGITTEFKHDKVWRIEKFAFRSSDGHVKRLKRETIAIVTVWK